MEKYINEDGKVGVLVSEGQIWSLYSEKPWFFAMDKTLIEMKLNDLCRDDVIDYISNSVGINDHYMGGWKTAKVHWVDKGTVFVIEMFDGHEILTLASDVCMIA